jgi:hypothetical protein
MVGACGSTSEQARRQTDDDPSATSSASAKPGATAAPGSNGSPATGSTGTGGVPGIGGIGGPVTASPPQLRGLTGRGVTKDTIKLGLFVSKNLQNAFLAVGLVGGGAGAGGSTNNEERYMNDMIIKDLNKRGGIAGRKIVPVATTPRRPRPVASTSPRTTRCSPSSAAPSAATTYSSTASPSRACR